MTSPVDRAIELHDQALELLEANRLEEAEAAAREALRLMESEQPGSPDCANLGNTLAELLVAAAKYHEAQDAAARSVAIMEAIPDALEDADCARVFLRAIQLRGVAPRSRGDYEGARPWALRARDLAAQVFGEDSIEMSQCLNEIGILGKFTARWDEAADAYARALAIMEREFGPESAAVATIHHNLGGLAHARGDFAAGEAPARRAYEIRRALLGEEHPVTQMDAVALAGVLDGLERYAESEPIYRRALEIYSATFGEEHYEVAATLHNLGNLRASMGELEDGAEMLRRSVAMKVRLLGADSPDTALGQLVRADVLHEMGRDGEARIELDQALAVFERTYDGAHPHLAAARRLDAELSPRAAG